MLLSEVVLLASSSLLLPAKRWTKSAKHALPDSWTVGIGVMTFTTNGAVGEALWLARGREDRFEVPWAAEHPSPRVLCQLIEELSGHFRERIGPLGTPRDCDRKKPRLAHRQQRLKRI